MPAPSYPPTRLQVTDRHVNGIGRSEIAGSPSRVQSCDLPQVGPIVADVTETWNWWLYFNGFPDGVELLKRGVTSVLVKRSPQSSSHADVRASDLDLVVTDGTGTEWTAAIPRRNLWAGDVTA